jgi:hypothetical protein
LSEPVHRDFNRDRAVAEVVGEREGVHELRWRVAADEDDRFVVEDPRCAVVDTNVGLAGLAASRPRPQLDVASNDPAC